MALTSQVPGFEGRAASIDRGSIVVETIVAFYMSTTTLMESTSVDAYGSPRESPGFNGAGLSWSLHSIFCFKPFFWGDLKNFYISSNRPNDKAKCKPAKFTLESQRVY